MALIELLRALMLLRRIIMMRKKTVASPAKVTIINISAKFSLFAAKVSLLCILLSVTISEILFSTSETQAQVAVLNINPVNKK